jgi:hypothetical protein
MSTIDEHATGTHPVNVGHLVMGLAFLGLCGIWVAVQGGWVETDNVNWLLPLPWVFAGAAGLIALAVGSRRSARHPAAEPTYDTGPEPYTDTTEITEENR